MHNGTDNWYPYYKCDVLVSATFNKDNSYIDLYLKNITRSRADDALNHITRSLADDALDAAPFTDTTLNKMLIKQLDCSILLSVD